MANIYQQAASRRKLAYLAAIAVLLVATLFVRGTVKVPLPGVREAVYERSIEGRAKKHELTELAQGDTQLGGAAINLILTGSRGLAVSALWLSAIDKQKEQEWNELDVAIKSITTLQPHFYSSWLFQSWNLAYNVSVEMDRLNDMYFYIARGISVIAEGEALNRNNPDLRYNAAFYYQNKFGSSDKVTTLKCLLQLSAIPDDDRNPERLLNADGTVNADAFEQFCRDNPQLVRRLKEARIVPDGQESDARPLALTPEAVVAFLKVNRKLPSRYKPGTKELKDRLDQFPVLPDMGGQERAERELNWKAPFADSEADGFLVARAWYVRANDAIPPPNSDPGADTVNPDPFRYRVPRRPSLVIFRQGAQRVQTYIADRLTKEGWFDKEWDLDDPTHDQAVWIRKAGPDGKPAGVRLTSQVTAQDAWKEAAARWREHGQRNGLALDPAVLATYLAKADIFNRLRPGLTLGMPTPFLRPEEANDPVIVEAHAAHRAVNGWISSRTVTNYETFQVEADAMSTDDATLARRLFFRADRAERVDLDAVKAVALLEEGFAAWKKVLSRAECRGRGAVDENQAKYCHDFRDLDHYQEETYTQNLRYVKLSMDRDLIKRRQATLWAHDLLRHAAGSMTGNPFQFAGDLSVLYGPAAELKAVVGLVVPGPFEGDAEDGKPWITDDVKYRLKEKFGLIKRKEGPPPGTGGPGMGGPGMGRPGMGGPGMGGPG